MDTTHITDGRKDLGQRWVLVADRRLPLVGASTVLGGDSKIPVDPVTVSDFAHAVRDSRSVNEACNL
eukprot:1457504-Lingulodinium_polyedra.AAC.1